jgi:hypothetical protein
MSSTTHPSPVRPSWRRRAAVLGLVAPLALVAACGSGGSDASSTTTTAAPATTEATTTTTEVDTDAAGDELQGLVEDADQAITQETADRDEMAADNDLAGAIESTAGLQAELESFQSDLSGIELPEGAQDPIDALNALDDATAEYIDALAGYQDVDDIAGYNDQLDVEAKAAKAWRAAVADAADALGIDGIDEGNASDDSSTSDDTGSDETATSAGLITGDGSEYCLQDGDLPDGFLPLTGKDNRSNALTYGFDGEEAGYANDLVASWMVLPEGAAGPDDLTATCLIHIFDSTASAEGFYEAWTADAGAGSYPTPEPVDTPEDAPGEDPQASITDVGGRPNGDQSFRYENVVVNVGIAGTSDNDAESVTAATNDLAKLVYERLQAAG